MGSQQLPKLKNGVESKRNSPNSCVTTYSFLMCAAGTPEEERMGPIQGSETEFNLLSLYPIFSSLYFQLCFMSFKNRGCLVPIVQLTFGNKDSCWIPCPRHRMCITELWQGLQSKVRILTFLRTVYTLKLMEFILNGT